MKLRLVEGGELYGKILKTAVRPNVVYLRLTSVAPDVKPVLERARAVLESALVST